MKTGLFQIIIFFAIYLLPPGLIAADIIPYEYRYETMGILILGVLVFTFFMKFNRKELGMRNDNFKKAFIIQMTFAFVVISLVVLMTQTGLIRSLEPPGDFWFYPMYLFISGPVQEFIYRSSVFAFLNRFDFLNSWHKISLVAFNFGWLHIIYLDWITLASTSVIGLIWTVLYTYRPNYWAISIGHALVGFSAIWFGLV